ncbi:CYTH domain-containing protein [Leucobacter sp. wl10]|uniref:CYTH domain-containing protein n=1 Tax=Leucobacter sp. wl10 TaxID=2304677 RepID=UPI000E5BC00B|nr:CYTH domain-containing protein [Leucobacter sp. wl10]RGE18968.1 CYTH domain-containing protein [Leucobacter sp. wl10]
MAEQASGARNPPDPGAEALEIERKYEVSVGIPLPAAERFREVGLDPEPPVTHRLSARYFDTLRGDLADRGLAMRERHGGKDAGWHLKQRGGAGVRELLWPPSGAVPEGLREELRGRIGDAAAEVLPVAQLRTERTVVMLRDREGRPAVELADDRVHALDLIEAVERAWREWEAELMPGVDAEVLDRVESVLLTAGGVHSLSFAKIARSTGRLLAAARAGGADEATLEALMKLDAADREAGRRLAT